MIFLAGHATRIEGKVYEFPTVILLEVLEKQKKDFFYLRHAIDGKAFSQLFQYKGGQLVGEYTVPSFRWFSVARYVSEILSTTLIGLIFRRVSGPITFIGIDPLNALAGIILRKLGLARKTIFYAVDYSPRRFSLSWLNSLYLQVDCFAALHSDQVWNVSSRIQAIRRKQGVLKDRNILVPNTPVSSHTLNQQKKIKHSLVSVGIIDKQLDFPNLFLAVKSLRKIFPEITVTIIGNGPLLTALQDQVKQLRLQKQVRFLGYQTHQKTLQYIAQHSVGLALYTGEWNFNYYGDSMKCREYFQYGLPVLTTDTHSTVEDIQKAEAGIVIQPTVEEYITGISQLFRQQSKYSQNAYRLAKKYQDIHAKLLLSLEQ